MLVRYVTDRGGEINEDFAGFIPHAAVVLDGAGTPDGVDSGCVHGVFWYVRNLGARLLTALDAAGDMRDCLATAIGEVAALHASDCDLTRPATPSATVAAFRATGDRLDYLVLCDATVLLGRRAGAEAISDRRVDALPRDIETVYGLRNRPGGYWVAAAAPDAAGEAITGGVPLSELHGAALLSDGAARLVGFGLEDWPGMLGILERYGPEELIRRVRAAEDTDPSASRWPRTKIHDDATVLYTPLNA